MEFLNFIVSKGMMKKLFYFCILITLVIINVNVYADKKTDDNVKALGNLLNLMGNEERREEREQARQPVNQDHCFVCNSFQNKGTLTYPSDFVGIKTSFSYNESMVIVYYAPSAKVGDSFELLCYNNSGALAFNFNVGVTRNGIVIHQEIPHIGVGSFRAIFKLNGSNVGEYDFTIN